MKRKQDIFWLMITGRAADIWADFTPENVARIRDLACVQEFIDYDHPPHFIIFDPRYDIEEAKSAVEQAIRVAAAP